MIEHNEANNRLYWCILDGDYSKVVEGSELVVEGFHIAMHFDHTRLPEAIAMFEKDYPEITVKSLFPIPYGEVSCEPSSMMPTSSPTDSEIPES